MNTINKPAKNMFLLFSHNPTSEQITDARASFGVEQIITMPADLKTIWQQIPAHAEAIDPLLMPVKKWLLKNGRQGDIALIQGDFGATWLLVNFTMGIGLLPVYSTTIREASETLQPDGSIRTEHLFRHCQFRRYGE